MKQLMFNFEHDTWSDFLVYYKKHKYQSTIYRFKELFHTLEHHNKVLCVVPYEITNMALFCHKYLAWKGFSGLSAIVDAHSCALFRDGVELSGSFSHLRGVSFAFIIFSSADRIEDSLYYSLFSYDRIFAWSRPTEGSGWFHRLWHDSPFFWQRVVVPYH